MTRYQPALDPFDDTPEGARAAEAAGTPRDRTPIEKLRSSTTYQTVRNEFMKWCRFQRRPDGTVGLACWICGRDIDYGLPHWSPWSFQLDHEIPVADRPDLMFAWPNLKPSHARCNQREGRRRTTEPEDMRALIGEPSEDW
jgi:hypothetical protein